MAVIRSVNFPFVRVEYDCTPAAREGAAVTRAGGVGVAFTYQSKAVWELAGKTIEQPHPVGVSLTGGSDMVWRRWSDVSEAVEFWLDEDWLERIAGVPAALKRLEPQATIQEPVLFAVAAQFCRAMSSDTVHPLKFEELAIAAARRLVAAPLTVDRARIVPLDDRRMRRVIDFIEANIQSEITLEDMASETAVSVFHFAKRFRATTGTSPYAFVIARRMSRAMQLLRQQGWPVSRVAQAVGYSQVGHFRRQFVVQWGQLPGRLDIR